MRREGTIHAAIIFCHSTPFPRLVPHPPATDTLPSLITITIATTIFSIMTRFSTNKIPTLTLHLPLRPLCHCSGAYHPQHLTDTINVVIRDIIVIAVLSWSSLEELPVRLLYTPTFSSQVQHGCHRRGHRRHSAVFHCRGTRRQSFNRQGSLICGPSYQLALPDEKRTPLGRLLWQ